MEKEIADKLEALSLHISYIEENMVTKKEIVDLQSQVNENKLTKSKIYIGLAALCGAIAFAIGYLIDKLGA